MEMIPYIILALVLCFTHLVQGVTGFGALVLALPVLTFFFPLKTLIPALVAVNLLQVGWFALTQRSHIIADHAKSIVLLSLLGLPFGFAVYSYLPSDDLKLLLGGVVTAVAAWNLLGLRLPWQAPDRWFHALNFAAGVVQGALATGGPLMVIYAARMIKDKSAFRATLSLVWLVLNTVLCLSYTVSNRWSADMAPITGIAVPTMVFGTVLGMKLHDLIPERPFRALVFALLLVSGLLLLRPLFSGG